MVVRKFWVPSIDARPSARSPLNTQSGQAYSLETGSDPFYPRGEVKADPTPLLSSSILDLGHERKPRKQMSQDEVDDEDNVVYHESLESGLRSVVLCASLCNTATLTRPTGDAEQWEANGDPTEIALQVAAHKLGHGKPFLTHSKHHLAKTTSTTSRVSRPPVAGQEGYYELLVEHPFDSTVKRMSIAYKFVPDNASSQSHTLCLLKGAVERVLERCTMVGDEKITDSAKNDIIAKMDTLAEHGLRVLALAGKRLSSTDSERLKTMPRDRFESDFTFYGLAGIFDPPRKESAGAVADCLRAGITPRMLTGDHPATATSIALSIGILDKAYSKSAVMTGQQFDALSNEQIDALEELPLVVARCAPETKVRMVDAIHRRGQTTVMTGDGVNDAPSLKRANVGVGMGTGSDVAKQSSNLVLADDNFATICRAIRKGRSVFKNLAKFLLVSCLSSPPPIHASGEGAELMVCTVVLAIW